MSNDEIRQAEKRGYSKGYLAGRRLKKRKDEQESRRRERQAFLDRAFLSILPAAMNAQGWTFGDTPISSTQDRVKLARRWAEEALKQRPFV
ncbi:MAG TPA: hypothetical protein VK149_12055 [Sideroxyarcus sp.]|nr:hypothetical protein [Sideroxyarcus sp.]